MALIFLELPSDGKTKAKPFYYYFDNQNKIAYIAFDNFVTDYDEWKNYYAGDKNALNLLEREDSYAFVLSSLKRAKTDGAKNVVFDFTTNAGGDLNSLLGIKFLKIIRTPIKSLSPDIFSFSYKVLISFP